MIGRLFASLFKANSPVTTAAAEPATPAVVQPTRTLAIDFQKAFDLIEDRLKDIEGLRLEAYPDPGSKDGKPWTIGYGTTRIEGQPVWQGLRITKGEAEMLFQADAIETMREILRVVKVPLNDKQLGALTSFVYNFGLTKFSKSTLFKKLNSGDYAGAAAEFPLWIHGSGGAVLGGLVKRRQWERDLFEGRI